MEKKNTKKNKNFYHIYDVETKKKFVLFPKDLNKKQTIKIDELQKEFEEFFFVLGSCLNSRHTILYIIP